MSRHEFYYGVGHGNLVRAAGGQACHGGCTTGSGLACQGDGSVDSAQQGYNKLPAEVIKKYRGTPGYY